MSIELPDIFKLRNLLALLAALGIEWALSEFTGVPFSALSFAAILVGCLVLAWLIERLVRWIGSSNSRRIN